LLRKSPATYKIPAQKTQEGKDVAEGTLIFDKETNTLMICIGKPYTWKIPASAFACTVEEPAVTEQKLKQRQKKWRSPKAWDIHRNKTHPGNSYELRHIPGRSLQ
jgi:hypothetical protein